MEFHYRGEPVDEMGCGDLEQVGGGEIDGVWRMLPEVKRETGCAEQRESMRKGPGLTWLGTGRAACFSAPLESVGKPGFPSCSCSEVLGIPAGKHLC